MTAISSRLRSAVSLVDKETLRRGLSLLLSLAVLALAAFLIYRLSQQYTLDDITTSLAAIPFLRLLLAAAFMVASYVCLTGFDYLGLRYAGHTLPYPYAALTSFVSLSLGHNVGMAGLSSGAVRYRFYARRGLNVGDVAKVILFSGATVVLGLMTLGGAAFLLHPQLAQDVSGFGRTFALVIGAACLVLVAAYLAAAAFVRGRVHIYRWDFRLPRLPLAAAQVALGTVNFAFVAACLYQGIAAAAEVGYFEVAAVYVIANTSALLSHVPGGLGVIESVVVFLLPQTGLIGALILFRVVYFLLPLVVGSALFAFIEFMGPETRSEPRGKR